MGINADTRLIRLDTAIEYSTIRAGQEGGGGGHTVAWHTTSGIPFQTENSDCLHSPNRPRPRGGRAMYV